MTTSDQLHLSPEDKNWRNKTFETYQTLKETNVAAARAWLKEVLQSDMHQEIGDRKKEVHRTRKKALEEIRSFDAEEQNLLEAQKALNSKRPSIDDLRKQLNTSEQQEKLDAEILRSNAVREWMYRQFPKDKQAFDLLTEKLINNPQKWRISLMLPDKLQNTFLRSI